MTSGKASGKALPAHRLRRRDAVPFQAVANQRLYQQVAEQVAALIRGGELRAGERLPPERDLAKRLGVSRPTVREAMIVLEIEGLVEVRTGSGIYVRNPEGGAGTGGFDAGPGAFELLAARLVIEPEIAAAAALAATPDDVRALAETIADLENAEDHRSSQEPDRRFHAMIAGATRNSVLVQIVENLWGAMFSPIFERLASQTGLPENRRMTVADHRIILAAIEKGDAKAAHAAMRAHLGHVEAILSSAAEDEAEAPRLAASR
jgi:DNA-binding FadR family transcriptional regulator